MRKNWSLTQRDTQILRVLSLRIRVASLSQLMRAWWRTSEGNVASRRLAVLERAGLLNSQRCHVALPQCTGPYCRWNPGDRVPNFGAIAWQLQHRSESRPASHRIYSATARGARRWGGTRQDYLARPFQLAHDLGVAEMFFSMLSERPHLAAAWIDEDRLAPFRKQQKLPDAVIATHPSAIPMLVLEFGGAYPKHRLVEFHDDCHQRRLPYEIW